MERLPFISRCTVYLKQISLYNMTAFKTKSENTTLIPLFQLQHLQLHECAADVHNIEVKIENDERQTILKLRSLFQVAACSIDNIFPTQLDQFLNDKPYIFYLKGIGLFSWQRFNIKTKDRDVIRSSIKEAVKLIEQTCLRHISQNGDEIGCQLKIAVSRE
jgi:hypothetical protein